MAIGTVSAVTDKSDVHPGADRWPTVLVVDDDEDILDSLGNVLKQELGQVSVRVAATGQQALDIIRTEPVHVIITDYRMPGMDGIEFLAQAQKLAPSAARLMMTAFPDSDLSSRATREVGVRLFIVKPFEVSYLLGVVRSIINGARAS